MTQAFNIEGVFRLQTAQAKAAAKEMRAELAGVAAAAKQVSQPGTGSAGVAQIRGPETVSGFTEAVEAATRSQSTFEAAVTGANRSVGMQVGEMLEAQRASAAYQAELDGIRAKFNPLFAASQQYEAQLREIAAAERMGAISAREAEAARGKASLTLADNTKKAGDAAGFATGGFRNLGMQLNQVAQVGGMTGNWMSAIAVQLPDMLLGFGTLGITLGIVAGLMIPFVSSLGAGADKGEAIAKAMDRAAESVDRARKSADGARASYSELVKEYGSVTDEILAMIAAQAELDRVQAEADMRSARDRMAELAQAGGFDFFTSLQAATSAALGGVVDAQAVEIQKLADTLGIASAEATRLYDAFQELEQAKTAEDTARAYARIREELAAAAGGAENMTAEQREMAAQALKGEQAARRVAAGLKASTDQAHALAGVNMVGGIQAASEEARQLAAFLGLSVASANALARNGAPAPRRLGFGLSYMDDPVVGGVRKLTFGSDPGTNRDGMIDNVTSVERDRKKNRGGKSDAEREADRARRQAERDARDVRDLIASLQGEIAGAWTLDPVLQQMARYREEIEKADPAQKAQIESLIRQKVEVEGLRDAWDYAGDSIYDALEGMALQGEKLGDVMNNLAGSIARALFQAAMLGSGPLAGFLGWQGGGGLIGAGLGAVLGTGPSTASAASGGTVTALLDLVGGGSFDRGGPTGGSDPSKIAGVVHQQEYVFDAASTAAIGVSNLDALRRGALKGYRSGGYVSSGPAPAFGRMTGGNAPSAPSGITINVDVTGANGDAQIHSLVATGVQNGVASALEAYDRQVLPLRFREISADERRIG